MPLSAAARMLPVSTTARNVEALPDPFNYLITARGLFNFFLYAASWHNCSRKKRQARGEDPCALTLLDKIWNAHTSSGRNRAEPRFIYIDRHLVHEVTSPQAFEGARTAGRKVREARGGLRRPGCHVPTDGRRESPIRLRPPGGDPPANCREFKHHPLPT